MENKNLKERIGYIIMSAIAFIVGVSITIIVLVFVSQMIAALFD